MATHNTLTELFTAIADSLRGKTGGSGAIVADDFPSVIDGISTGGITPSGTKTITENGTYDVTNYASAVVNVPSTAQNSVTRTVALDAITGANTTVNLLTGDDFIKTHYADDGFFATFMLSTPTASETGRVHFAYAGNKNIGSSVVARYGLVLSSTSASALGVLNQTAAINGKGYNVSLRAASDGSLKIYLAAGKNLAAGDYQIVLGVAE